MKKILVVEDDAMVAGIYRNKLLSEGFRVEIVGDGEAAIWQLKSRPPDLMILDLGLPKINGVEVLKFVRANAQTTALPVLVLSNSYVTSLVDSAWQEGANRCMSKGSCTPKQLADVIHELFAAAAPKGVSAAPEVEAAAAAEISDAEFQEQIRLAFLDKLPSFKTEMRKHLQLLARGGAAPTSPPENVLEFSRLIQTLAEHAGLAGFQRIAQLASALDAFLKELYEKPKNIGPSPVRTIANAIDQLIELFDNATAEIKEPEIAPAALVLDDDPISRRTVCVALEKARLRAISVDDPVIALKLLEENSFELILSDVNMPAMSGFLFCKKARELPRHRATPVIFVTALSDFESKANSKLSGGTDLIGKPFLLLELAVKALTSLFRVKPASASNAPSAALAPVVSAAPAAPPAPQAAAPAPAAAPLPPEPPKESDKLSAAQQIFRRIRQAREK